jgi:tetratricopeptide (TPR) repeat protein
MRNLVILGIIILIIGCSARQPIQTTIYIPDMDLATYNDSFYKQGWQFLKAGNSDLAFKNFQQSSQTDDQIFVGFAYAFLLKKKFNFAMQNFQKALEINPDNINAALGMAALYEMTEKPRAAFDAYKNILGKNPEHMQAKIKYELIKSIETQKLLDQANEYKETNNVENYISFIRQAAYYSPDIIEIPIQAANYLYEQEKFKEAAEYYELIVEKSPNRQDVLQKLADIYEKLENYEQAVIYYRRLLSLKPGDEELTTRINHIKNKYYETGVPTKFKNIFFKDALFREDLAALLDNYFESYLTEMNAIIITDIDESFARDHILRVCANGIMKIRPDNTFDRFSIISRADFAVILKNLIDFLEKRGETLHYTPIDKLLDPMDVSPLHKDYQAIRFLVNVGVMKLDDFQQFSPTMPISPAEADASFKKIAISLK